MRLITRVWHIKHSMPTLYTSYLDVRTMGGWQSGQMHRAVNPTTKVYAGSNPAPPKSYLIHGSLAQLARAPALHAGGQGFDSLRIHHSRLIVPKSRNKSVYKRYFKCLESAFFVVKYFSFKNLHRLSVYT